MPICEKYYTWIQRYIPDAFDTDQFGTFSWEVKRPADMLETAIIKAKYWLSVYPEYHVSIATEWSFTTIFPWSLLHSECMVLRDSRHEYLFSTVYKEVVSWWSYSTAHREEMKTYVTNLVSFPNEGIILFPESQKTSFFSFSRPILWVTTWVTNWSSAEEAFQKAKKYAAWWVVCVAQDFRALHHPVRMKNIWYATEQLCSIIQSYCPSCSAPWWSKKSFAWKAACRFCGSLTLYPTYDVWWCISCSYTEQENINLDKLPLDSCGVCNP